MLQDAYVRAFSSLADFQGRSALSTWLARIVMNEAMRRLGRSRPTFDLSVLDAEAEIGRAPLLAEGPTTPEQETARREIRRAVERAIDSLPGPFRTVFVMRVIEQTSIEETAAVLGIPAATVKTRLNRANQALRRSLGSEFGAVLGSAFPFAGVDCDRLTSSVLARVVGERNRAPLTS